MTPQLNDERIARGKLGGIGRTKFYELLASGELKSLTIGRRRLVSDEAIDEFIRARERNDST